MTIFVILRIHMYFSVILCFKYNLRIYNLRNILWVLLFRMTVSGALEKPLAEKCKYKLAATTSACMKWSQLNLGMSFNIVGAVFCSLLLLLAILCFCTKFGKGKGTIWKAITGKKTIVPK